MIATQEDTQHLGQFGWLVNNFAESVPGVAHAVVVSVDGLLLASSARLPVDRAQQMSAISAGIVSLNLGAAKCLGADKVIRSIVEMDHGALLITSIKDGSCLAVLAVRDCDISQVAYEMTVLVDQVGEILTPQLRAALATG
ncbi:roadblock/LC7 domain-containing protein [Actinophytocola xanthii]|uniref:Dynein regulation protein LC7 n=1 Tax=Actinophytocola xanthii TaxID=1912961 RepID=A0A1Q8CME2_9PSEU|nr:roadblock/LC7 domain-containing protein [Actinophytocola xanthii]OLF15533.1 dynein regulation protein LC7 [Actinophytocola xanthii]